MTSPATAVAAAGGDWGGVVPTVRYGLLSWDAGGTFSSTPGASPSFIGPPSPGPYQNAPVWVVTYVGVSPPMTGPPCPPGGCPPAPSTTVGTVPAGSGSTYVFVDDRTGQNIMGLAY